MTPTIQSSKAIQWDNVFFFSFTAICTFIATPLYIYKNGLALSEVLLFFFFVITTGLAITVGYHRLYAHATFKAHPIVHFFILFFGAAAFEQSAIRWSAQHRSHHQFVDTEQDPYNIKKGFFYAHIGWLLFWRHETSFNNVKDLERNKLVAHQHNHMALWGLNAGVILPLIIGALTGHLLGAFLISVCARFTFVHHSTFSINSVCHMFGKATYDIYASAKDHWLVAFLTNGEGYHNFHHRFPADYRNGVRWYQWDPSKWLIAGLAKLGLAKNLRKVSRFIILEARLAADKQRVNDLLAQQISNAELHNSTADLIKAYYQNLKETLEKWDHAVREYREVLAEKSSHSSAELRKAALLKVRLARAQFKTFHSKWRDFIELHPLEFHNNLHLLSA